MRKFYRSISFTLLSSQLLFGSFCWGPTRVHAHESFVQDIPQQEAQPAGSNRISSVSTENPFTPEARALLQEAVQQTSAGELDAARATYEKLIQTAPEVGYPRFARFLSLTNPEQVEGFARALSQDVSVPLFLRAKTLLILDRAEEVETLLEPNMDSLPEGDVVAGTILLSSAYRKTGQTPKADELVVKTLRKVNSPQERAELANHFFTRLGQPLPDQAGLLITALDLGFIEMKQSTVNIREVLDLILVSQQEEGTYFDLKDALEKSPETLGPVSLHLLVRLYLQEGRMESASQLLGAQGEKFSPSPYYVQLAKERVALLESTMQFDLARDLSLEIARREKADLDRPQQNYFLTFIATGQYEDAQKVRPDLEKALQEPRERALIIGLVKLAAYEKEIETMIDLYAALPKTVVRDERRQLHKEIFKQLNNTSEHLSIEIQIRRRFDENPTGTPPALWLLAGAAAAESKLKPNEFEARYQYSVLEPNDSEELEALAMESSQIALELNTASDEELAQFEIPFEERTRFTSLAKQSLELLIKARPYSPEPMQQLIRLYKQENDEEKAIAVPEIIAANTSNVELLKTCGLVLNLEGYPEQGLKYYNRALELDPENFDVLTNRAASYTRLGRWDETTAFYKQALEKGFKNRPWHNHDYVIRLWAVAETLDQEKEMEAYFKQVAEDTSIPWHDSILDNLAALFMKLNRPEDAEYYAQKIIQRRPEPSLRLKIWEKLISAYSENPEKSESLFTEGLKDLETESEEYSTLTTSYARFLSDQGRDDDAIAQLMKLHNTQKTKEAVDAIFYAALIADKTDQAERAKEYYTQFLATKSVNFMLRNEAEKRLEELNTIEETTP